MCEEMTGDTAAAAAAAAAEANIRSCWLIVSPSAQCLHSNLRFNLLLPADKREREGRANGSSIASLMIADDGWPTTAGHDNKKKKSSHCTAAAAAEMTQALR